MTDLSQTIAAKSNQMNADDLVGCPRTIRITRVSSTGSSDQPIAIGYEGDEGKPFMPCKTVRRLLVAVWGADGSAYVGRAMTLYRDADVEFGGIKVGGIRVSHMSHIDQPMTVALTEKRARKRPITVKPLKMEAPKQAAPKEFEIDEDAADEAAAKGMAAYRAFVDTLPRGAVRNAYVSSAIHDHRKNIANRADDAAMLNDGEAAE